MHILSFRELETHPARTMIYQLEDLMVKLCGAKLISPRARTYSGFSSNKTGMVSRGYRKAIRTSIGSFQPESPPVSETDDNVLLIVALNGTDLQMLNAVKGWRTSYDYVAAYLFDAWVLEAIPTIARQLDQIIAPYPEAIPALEQQLGVKATAIPAGHDILGHGAFGGERDIDVISYGRSCDAHLAALTKMNADKDTVMLYDHPGFPSIREPAQTFSPGRQDWDNKAELLSSLRRSKTALAFENFYTTKTTAPGVHIAERLQHSILTQRWFECLGSGCVVLGKRPRSESTRSYLDWPESTIELPDDPTEGVNVIKAVLEDTTFLAAQGEKNYFECLLRNDWRLRIRQFYRLCSLPEPPKLTESIAEIEQLYDRYNSNPDTRLPNEYGG